MNSNDWSLLSKLDKMGGDIYEKKTFSNGCCFGHGNGTNGLR